MVHSAVFVYTCVYVWVCVSALHLTLSLSPSQGGGAQARARSRQSPPSAPGSPPLEDVRRRHLQSEPQQRRQLPRHVWLERPRGRGANLQETRGV